MQNNHYNNPFNPAKPLVFEGLAPLRPSECMEVYRTATLMSKKNPNWSREQHILAFRLYNEIPFGKIHTGNPQLQALAKLIGFFTFCCG